jgi:sarcosine oxidase, subunit alpha
VVPAFHCTQEIPCNPCASLCPHNLIYVDDRDIRAIPAFLGNNYCCEVCERCVAGCPGLAITLIDYRNNPDLPIVSIPYEFTREAIQKQDFVTVLNTLGTPLANLEVLDLHTISTSDRTLIVQVQAPKEIAAQIAGIRIQEPAITLPADHYVPHIADDTIVCRCERVTAGEIRGLIRKGFRDMNELKIVTRAGMGACGAKTCNALIHRIFREEGVEFDAIVEQTKRPIFMEVPIGTFAGSSSPEEE